MGTIKYRVLGCSVLAALLYSGAAWADDLASGEPSDLFEMNDEFVTGVSALTSFIFLPDGRMVITEKGGRLLVRDTAGALVEAGTFPVDSSSEKGLLNVVAHPDFPATNLLFLYYSLSDGEGGSNTDRHRVVSVPLGSDNKVDRTQEKVLVKDMHGPANHDGGALAIGPDNKLYIGVGDTGHNSGHLPTEQNPPTNFFGTCLNVPNGKILRVELDGAIPADNPLSSVSEATTCGSSWGDSPTTTAEPRKDIWAWGFRNPWRFSFDPVGGALWVGDVGEVTHEEIDVIAADGAGKHYGWPWREAAFGYAASKCADIVPNVGDCVDPVFSCTHANDDCRSITGGITLDTCQLPEAQRGFYYFGDSGNSAPWSIWRLKVATDRKGVTGERQNFATASSQVVHFNRGPDGALYYGVYSGQSSHITRIAPKTPEDCGTGGAGGMGGVGGSGGSAGTGGTGGTGGGDAGMGGESTGGSSGTGGSGGTGGKGGSGATGGNGTGGNGTGGGGTSGAGAGGSGTAGTAGAAGSSAGTSGSDDSSCGCQVPSGNASRVLGAFGALTALAFGLRRRRR